MTITNMPISVGPNAHTYAKNRRESGCRFSWENLVWDLLYPRSNCLPFLQNLWLQLSTPWPSGTVRSSHGGRAKGKVQTTILGSVLRVCWECLESLLGSIESSRLGVCHQVQLGVYLRASWELIWECKSSRLGECYREQWGECAIESNWERTVEQAGSVQSSVIWTVFESLLGSMLESVLRSLLGAYSPAGGVCAIECNWDSAMKYIWQLVFKFVVCSVMYGSVQNRILIIVI